MATTQGHTELWSVINTWHISNSLCVCACVCVSSEGHVGGFLTLLFFKWDFFSLCSSSFTLFLYSSLSLSSLSSAHSLSVPAVTLSLHLCILSFNVTLFVFSLSLSLSLCLLTLVTGIRACMFYKSRGSLCSIASG